MYGVIALISSVTQSRVVLLPLEQHHSFEVDHWLDHLKNEDLSITTELVPLAIGDWIVKNVRYAVRTGQLRASNAMLKSYIARILISIGHSRTLQWKNYSPCQDAYKQDETKLHHAIQMNDRYDHALSVHRVRRLLLQWLQGRKLLYEEWLALVEERIEDYNAKLAVELIKDKLTLEQVKSSWRWLLMKGYVRLRSSIEWRKLPSSTADLKLRCLRCYETKLVQVEHLCRYCGVSCYYCSSCLQLGRARTCAALVVTSYHSPLAEQLAINDLTPEALLKLEDFGLSDAQHMATTTALGFVHKQLKASYRASDKTRGENEYVKEESSNKMFEYESISQTSTNRLQFYKQMIRRLGEGSSSTSQGDLSSQFLLWAVTETNNEYIKN